MSVNYDGHRPDARGFCVRGDGRWPCEYAEKCDELGAERERREQADRERAQYQESIARLEAELLPLRAIADAVVVRCWDGGIICRMCGWYGTNGVAHDRGCPVAAWEEKV